uniref:Uncharacterized protein n=2 Tax=Meloidogyne TaxID=189290 RepID=A0A6V7XE58_MELEN|nr:unnamed protein product [Meloidogyne enterolobii]
MYPVEKKGRGLPHIHLLLSLFDIDKVISSQDGENRGISAILPYKDKDIELFESVKKFMIPCGDLNRNCPCMEDKGLNEKKIKCCSKGYSNPFQQETIVLDNGLALFARLRDGRTIEVLSAGKGHELFNR